MPTDFSAKQIRVSQLIASGGVAGTSAGLVIYSASAAPDLEGTVPTNLTADFGSDVFLFVSGTKNGRETGEGNITLFGGDVVVSGTLYADKQVIEIDETVTGSLSISGSLIVSQSAIIQKGMEVNASMGTEAGSGGDDFIVFGGSAGKEIIAAHASSNQVLILSGGGITSANERNYLDTAFFVSGAVGSRGSSTKGVAIFGGDSVISGSLTVENGSVNGGTISGSIHQTENGISYLAEGDNVTIASASSGQITITSIDTNTTYTAGDGLDLSGTTFSTDLKSGGGLKIDTTELAVEPANFAGSGLEDDGSDNLRINDDIVATISGSTFTGVTSHVSGLSGSLTRLVDGTAYIAGGVGATVTSASNGQITISTDGTVPGGSNTQLQYNNNGVMGGISGATTDGSVTTFSDTGILVGQYITHTGDPNTQIRFETDEIRLETGGVDYIKTNASETAITLNPDNAVINTLIYSQNKTGIIVASATDQVLILSGGGATSYNSAIGSDVSFYISGSATNLLTAPLSFGTSVSNYEGDLVVSGAIRGKNISLLGVNPQANDLILHAEGTNYSFGANHNILAPNSAVVSPGGDVFFAVSGSMGGKGATGTSVFGGDVVVSGSLRARELKFTTHKFVDGNGLAQFVRFDKDGSDAGAGEDNKMVTPYIGTLIKVVARCEGNAGQTGIALHRATDGNTDLGGAVETITVTIPSVDTTSTFNFTSAANWGPGDIVGLSFDPAVTAGVVVLTAVWEFETY